MSDLTNPFAFPLARRQEHDDADQEVVVNKDPAPTVNASLWTMMAFSTAFLAVRLYCKLTRKGMWWDDHIMVVGWMFLLASTAVVTELMRLDFGMTPGFVPHTHTLSIIADVLNKCALGLTKTSFGLTLLRVSEGWRCWFIWFLLVTMNAILATNAVTTWRGACEREGIDEYEAVLPGDCWSVRDAVTIAMVANGYSAIVDFILALMPWSIVWKLQMKRIEKVGVVVAMSLGMVAGAVGVVKVVHTVTIAQGPDIPYRLSMLFIWGWAEPNVTIIACSIPVLRVLLRDFHRSRYGTGTYETYGTAGTGRGGNSTAGYLKSNDDSRFPSTTMPEGKRMGGDHGDADEASDTGILGSDSGVDDAAGGKMGRGPEENGRQGPGDIVRTTEVAIVYDRRSSDIGGRDLEEGYEMVASPESARGKKPDGFGRAL